MIKVHYQNQDFMVVIKPEDVNFHCQENELGLIEQLKKQLELEKIFPVHRLDKMTSGLLLVALNLKTAQCFQQMFENCEIEKYYLAVSNQKPKKKQGWIKGKMVPGRNGSWKFSNKEGRFASTQFISVSTQPGERLYLLKPHTGRTHQLRVAMKSLSAPICGDVRYAHKTEANQEQRGYLHAYGIKFALENSLYEFVCLPESGERFLSQACCDVLIHWSKPWTLFKG